MTFKQSEQFKVPTKKYNGQIISEVAKSDSGLKFLDWVRRHAFGDFKDALDTYFKNESIQRELNALL